MQQPGRKRMLYSLALLLSEAHKAKTGRRAGGNREIWALD